MQRLASHDTSVCHVMCPSKKWGGPLIQPIETLNGLNQRAAPFFAGEAQTIHEGSTGVFERSARRGLHKLDRPTGVQ